MTAIACCVWGNNYSNLKQFGLTPRQTLVMVVSHSMFALGIISCYPKRKNTTTCMIDIRTYILHVNMFEGTWNNAIELDKNISYMYMRESD